MKGKFEFIQNPFYVEGKINQLFKEFKSALIYLIKLLKPE
jgi:hypothetical protein